MIMVIGQASSGKSMYAETLAIDIANKNKCEKLYLATMENETAAAKARIEKHRKMREGKGFLTIEEMYNIRAHEPSVEGKLVLLECMSNLCANVLYKKYGDVIVTDENIEEMSNCIFDDVGALANNAKELIIVSADVFSDGIKYDDWTEGYLKLLANVNKKIAHKCDGVYEVVANVAMSII